MRLSIKIMLPMAILIISSYAEDLYSQIWAKTYAQNILVNSICYAFTHDGGYILAGETSLGNDVIGIWICRPYQVRMLWITGGSKLPVQL